MGKLLGLGAVELGNAGIAEDLAQGGLRHVVLEGVGQRVVLVVLHDAGDLDPVHPAPVEGLEVGLEEGLDHLPRAVLAEIEVDDLIAVLDQFAARDDGGLDELVVLAGLIGQVDRRAGGRRVPALTVHQAAPGQFGALPALVAIHGVVTPGDGGHGPTGRRQGLLHRGEVALGRAGRGVAPVGEDMDHRPRPLAPTQLDQGHELIDVAVHAPIRDQAHQVDRPTGGGGLAGGGGQDRIREEAPIRDGGIDQDQVLLDHPAATQAHVSDLGVAHLSVRQADGQPGGQEGAVRKARVVLVELGRLGDGDGVVGLARIEPEAVQDDEDHRAARCLGNGVAHGVAPKWLIHRLSCPPATAETKVPQGWRQGRVGTCRWSILVAWAPERLGKNHAVSKNNNIPSVELGAQCTALK